MEIVKLDSDVGGDLGNTINELNGKKFRCHCGKSINPGFCADFRGYTHENGLPDSNGTKWWLFLECPHCTFNWSWTKIKMMIAKFRDDDEDEGEGNYPRHPLI
jgi:hypothetical protein